MILTRFRLDGRVALISGAGRGIGRAIALGLAEAGANVVVAARTVAQLEDTAAAARDFGVQALAVRCDVKDVPQVEALASEAAQAWGRLDVLVNVAGGTLPCPAMRTSDTSLERAFSFNVTSAFRLTKLVVPHMLEAGSGSIVNISSALSHYVESGFVAYGTAKAALSHMTRLLAYEFAPRIRVNGLAVGSIETAALAPFLSKGGLKEQMEELTPMARLGTPEDVAAAALYLASPASSWVTGKIFEIDGGTVASNWPIKIPGL